jgi:hypothetical protein
VSTNPAINGFKIEANRKEFTNISIKGNTKIEKKTNSSAKTKDIFESKNINHKFKRVKRQSNLDSSNNFIFFN